MDNMGNGEIEAFSVLLTCLCPLIMMAVFGFIGYSLGKNKSVGPIGGALLCAFLGIIGLIIVAVLPEQRSYRPRRRPIQRSGGGRGRGPRPGPRPGARPPSAGEPEPVFELNISCPKCGKRYTIYDPNKAGTQARCSDCNTVFLIPKPQ